MVLCAILKKNVMKIGLSEVGTQNSQFNHFVAEPQIEDEDKKRAVSKPPFDFIDVINGLFG